MRKLSPIFFALALLLTGGAWASSASPAAPSSLAPLVARAPHVLPPLWGAEHKVNTDSNVCNGNYTNCAQHEPEIAINPLNNLNAIAGFKDWRDGFKQVYLGTTTDGGATWINQLPTGVTGLDVANESDPVVVFGADGVAYASVLAYGGSDEGVYVTKSTDGGLTWSQVRAVWVGGQGNADKDWLTIDKNPASPYYNRLYSTWTNLGANREQASYSSDGGQTWSSPANLNSGGWWVQIPVVLPNGHVVVTIHTNPGSDIQVVRSTNGGQTWSAPTSAVNVTRVYCWISCTRNGQQQNWRMSTMQAAAADPNNGYIYMVWLDGRNDATNGWDIYYSRSTDEGVTWSAPVRLNDDPSNHFIDQVLPTIAVAPDGTVHAAWMDKRIDPNNLLMNLYYTYSTDNGVTWQPDVRLSTQSSNYNIGIPGDSNNAASDYIGMSAITDTVWIDWLDTRNNQQDIYSIRGTTGNTTPTPSPTPGGPTATATSVPPSATATMPPSATATSAPATVTSTPTPPAATATATPPMTATMLPTDTATPNPQITPTASPTLCPNPFVDINGNVFAQAILALYCRGVVNGTDGTHYTPAGTSTRAQFAKVVVLGFSLPSYTPTGGGQDFTDVPPTYWAYAYIEAGYHYNGGILQGFDPATCQAAGATPPCYLPNRPITRAQLTKLVVAAAGYTPYTPTMPTFSDVGPSNVFYVSIETAVHKGIINGYPDNTFRPNNNIRRDEMAQIVYTAINTP